MPPHPLRLSRLWREVALSLQLLGPPVSEFPGSAISHGYLCFRENFEQAEIATVARKYTQKQGMQFKFRYSRKVLRSTKRLQYISLYIHSCVTRISRDMLIFEGYR